MNILIADIDNNVSLDSKAMTGVLGGWVNIGSSVSYYGYTSTGWSAWMSAGVPFLKKRYRDRYRTKLIRIRQWKREWQFRRGLVLKPF